MVITYSRVWINRVRLPILLVVSSAEKMNISMSPFAPENLVSRDGFGCPVPRQPARSPLRLYLNRLIVLTDGIPSTFRGSVHLFIPLIAISSVQSLPGHAVAYQWLHCRESAGTGPVVLKVVPVTGAAFSGFTIDQFLCASLFPNPLLVYVVDMRDTENIGKTS